MIRVLQIVTYMGRGGLETMIMNYYRNIDRNKVQFDFLVHRQEEADYDIDTLLYKVQSKMISNEKISVSPKFIFTFILKHYQHFIGRNDIFKCRQPKL